MTDPLYGKEILRLAADAAGAGRLSAPHASATANNPACGDRATVELAMEHGRIVALAYQTHACVLTQASAAILGAGAMGLDRAGMAALARSLQAMLTGGAPPPPPFERYAAFAGAAGHKGRHKCVLLPLEAALEALEALEPAEPGR